MKNNETDNFNFNSFSDLEFYKKVNSNLLDLADLNSSNKIIDLIKIPLHCTYSTINF